MLVNVYSTHTGVIHKNISDIVPHLPKMAGPVSMKICDLIKEIAIHSPKVTTTSLRYSNTLFSIHSTSFYQ